MKQLLFVVVILPLITMLMLPGDKNLLTNGSFERFVGGEPVGWVSNNIPNMLNVVSQYGKSSAGKSSVKCAVKYLSGTRMAGMIVQKDIAVNDGELQFDGVYMLSSIDGDVGFVTVDVKTEEGSTMATCEHYLRKPADEFVAFSFSAKLPESARSIDVLLTMIAEKGSSLHEGSHVVFDDLRLTVKGKEEHAQ